jgi:hypothetical protein
MQGDKMKCEKCPYNNQKKCGKPFCVMPNCLYTKTKAEEQADRAYRMREDINWKRKSR